MSTPPAPTGESSSPPATDGQASWRASSVAWAAALLRPTNLPFAVASLLLAGSVWLPTWTLQRPTWDYLVAFDITQSMNVDDMAPPADEGAGTNVTRLAAARDAMRLVLRRLPCGSKIGWAVFADYRVMPLVLPVEVCGHYEELLASLDRIDGRMRWANASNIGKGITWAIRTARTVGPQTHVVFFTDGQEAPPLRDGQEPPMQDIEPGAVGGIVVGVGGDLPARIPRTDKDGQPAGYWEAGDVVQRAPGSNGGSTGPSQEQLSSLQEGHLRTLAKLTGLGYLRLSTAAALGDRLTDRATAEPAPVATDLRWVLAAAALLVMAVRFLPRLGVGRRRAGGTVADAVDFVA